MFCVWGAGVATPPGYPVGVKMLPDIGVALKMSSATVRTRCVSRVPARVWGAYVGGALPRGMNAGFALVNLFGVDITAHKMTAKKRRMEGMEGGDSENSEAVGLRGGRGKTGRRGRSGWNCLDLRF
jgi:hypothetical protein